MYTLAVLFVTRIEPESATIFSRFCCKRSLALIIIRMEEYEICLPAGDVTETDWPVHCWLEFWLPLLPALVFNFLNCFLCFIRRFWNHVFTWVSERWRAAASSTLSGVLRYLCTSNLASKPANCWSLNT